jgi:light-regulated signal transduction histidine kinase (bacteriophytochrome)
MGNLTQKPIIGIVDEEQVFGIFKRLHTPTKYSGTGMGLAICQRIVQRYRGRIWATSEKLSSNCRASWGHG